MTINPEALIKFSSTHRLQWEDAQQKYVILYPEGMVELNQSSAENFKSAAMERIHCRRLWKS
ncbi:hypothetical protein [Methylocucumis oryzae]|uniref:hypothetical protein n=1 Tax=Methylocucumis oryzae TaxID=1632867 RepID=UPI000B057A5B